MKNILIILNKKSLFLLIIVSSNLPKSIINQQYNLNVCKKGMKIIIKNYTLFSAKKCKVFKENKKIDRI